MKFRLAAAALLMLAAGHVTGKCLVMRYLFVGKVNPRSSAGVGSVRVLLFLEGDPETVYLEKADDDRGYAALGAGGELSVGAIYNTDRGSGHSLRSLIGTDNCGRIPRKAWLVFTGERVKPRILAVVLPASAKQLERSQPYVIQVPQVELQTIEGDRVALGRQTAGRSK